MRTCKRCGIDIERPGLCQDCLDVTGEQPIGSTRMVPRITSGYRVNSDRKPGVRISNREDLMNRAVELSARGLTANEVAVEVGVASRTVVRWKSAADSLKATSGMISGDLADLARRITEFWSLVSAGPKDACWPWNGYAEDGYGKFYFDGRMRPAHELALTFATGERRAPSLDTCHGCNNPICCNPSHLRFDTRKSNVADMIAAGRHQTGTKKLDPEKVLVIRERRAAGATQTELAADYGVTDGLISQIVRGIRWADAPGPIETERKYNRG